MNCQIYLPLRQNDLRIYSLKTFLNARFYASTLTTNENETISTTSIMDAIRLEVVLINL